MITDAQLHELRQQAESAANRRPILLIEVDPRVLLSLLDEIETLRPVTLTIPRKSAWTNQLVATD